MGLGLNIRGPGCRAYRRLVPLVLAIEALALASALALPRRLVLGVDGISYRDMQALQAGVTYTNLQGRHFQRRAFNDGYYPASRNVSTFPSTSDVAWTDIFGDRPLPGYQRTYFSVAGNRQLSENSVTSSVEHERQMNWQVESGYRRAMAYVYPQSAFDYELRAMVANFLSSKADGGAFYVYLRTTDDAQHMSGDVFAMLATLNDKLEELRRQYRAREGRELEVLIISDHGHNHAGTGRRVEVTAFLKQAGYRVTTSIVEPRDVVLPTCGIESWVEIHNAPTETERLAQLLCRLAGADLVTARLPDPTNQFLVLNANGERGVIDWKAASGAYRYTVASGDPLGYLPVVAALAQRHLLDADGFAPADVWLAATLTNRYPLALERIVDGFTRITLNPATILVSLSNGYVNAGWLVDQGSRLLTQGGTHGGLDDLNSDGMVLSNFGPTQDTSTRRVAEQFGGFPGLRNYRVGADGAEWVTAQGQALTRIARVPFDSTSRRLPGEGVFLRVWTPGFEHQDGAAPVEVTIEKSARHTSAPIHRWDSDPNAGSIRHLALKPLISSPDEADCERVYALPSDLNLEPGKAYVISGRLADPANHRRIFNFTFRTDSHGVPVAY